MSFLKFFGSRRSLGLSSGRTFPPGVCGIVFCLFSRELLLVNHSLCHRSLRKYLLRLRLHVNLVRRIE
eukprot:2888160-Amphidinium_carterae.1